MKTPEKEMTGQIIGVDAGKLSQGLRTAFEGVAMIFDSLGADFTPDTAEAFRKCDAEESETEQAEQSEQAGATEKTAEKADAQAASDPEEKAEPVDTEDTADMGAEKKENTPSITLDDVTKIIVQKIKQNRSNNEKIGQILKSYGAAKVGELPADKYEAFLTDLAAL